MICSPDIIQHVCFCSARRGTRQEPSYLGQRQEMDVQAPKVQSDLPPFYLSPRHHTLATLVCSRLFNVENSTSLHLIPFTHLDPFSWVVSFLPQLPCPPASYLAFSSQLGEHSRAQGRSSGFSLTALLGVYIFLFMIYYTKVRNYLLIHLTRISLTKLTTCVCAQLYLDSLRPHGL